jgi:hypothetical protein
MINKHARQKKSTNMTNKRMGGGHHPVASSSSATLGAHAGADPTSSTNRFKNYFFCFRMFFVPRVVWNLKPNPLSLLQSLRTG